MALRMNYDINTGIELDGMYFRIDKINFNDTHFQVIATGYASEDAFRSGKMPISEPRAYTIENYDKNDISKVFQFGYEMLKYHPVFKDAEDLLTDNQKSTAEKKILADSKIEKSENGLKMKGSTVNRYKKGLD